MRILPNISLTFSLLALTACGSDETSKTQPDKPTGIQLEILSFDANPKTVTMGDVTKLSWEVKGPEGTTVTVVGGGVNLVRASTKLQGEVSTGPIPASRTFTLKAAAGDQKVAQKVTVTGKAPKPGESPEVVSFQGNQDVKVFVRNGTAFKGPASISWEVRGADQVRILNPDGTELVTDRELKGTHSFMLGNDEFLRELTLVATKGSQSTSRKTKVGTAGVILQAVAFPSFTTDAQEPVTLQWKVIGTLEITDSAGQPVQGGANNLTLNLSQAERYTFKATQLGKTTEKVLEVPRGVTDTAAHTGDRYIRGKLTAGAHKQFNYTLSGGDTLTAVSAKKTGGCATPVTIFDDTDQVVGAGSPYAKCIWQLPDAKAGTYKVQVMSPVAADYDLIVDIQSAVCGDHTRQKNAAEECDDGNKTSGDGCSETCKIEPTGAEIAATETRDVVLAVDQTVYVPLKINSDTTLKVASGTPKMGSCEGKPNLALTVTTPDGDPLVATRGPCASLRTMLAPGNYMLGVLETEGNPVPKLQLKVELTNLSISTLQTTQRSANVTTDTGLPGVARLHLEAAQTVSIASSGGCSTGGASQLGLQKAGTAAPTALTKLAVGRALYAISAEATCASFDPKVQTRLVELEAGDYLVGFFDKEGSTPVHTTLTLSFIAAACNNHILESTEGCDDPSGANCNSTCGWTGPVEPNTNTPASLTLPALARGSLDSGSDKDPFNFTLSTPQTVTIATRADRATDACPKGDPALTLFKQGQVAPIASNDDASDESLCPKISQQLEAGTYTVEVSSTAQTPVPVYFLSVTAE